MNNVHFMSEKDDWETPQSLFDQLHAHFHFTLDAAASDSNHKLPRYYTKETDGLAQDWGGSESSVIRPMEMLKQVYGLKSAMKKLKSLILLWFFSFRHELTVNRFMISSTTNRVLLFTS